MTTRDAAEEAEISQLMRSVRPPPMQARSLEQRLGIASILQACGTLTGTTRVGRLEVQSRLGGGAMGVVYRAHDPALQRSVALKVLRGWTGPAEGSRILEEARRLARVSHPNVVAVHDVVSDDGGVHIAMEYVAGPSLEAWLSAHPAASWREVLRWFLQAGQGLAAAHAAGVVHRDFKAANVIAADDGRARVVDFGLAVLQATPDEHAPAGTPFFMAPEVRAGAAATPESDQFSFCQAAQLALSDRGAPPPVAAALAHGLSADPRSRHADMASLVEVLARALDGGDVQRPRVLLLDRVEALWLRQVEGRGLANGRVTELTLRRRGDLVETPWASWDRATHASLPPGADASSASTRGSRRLTALLADSGNSLLLLGAPGGGKTTLLLELCRELWRTAQLDSKAPAPVVLSLSSYRPCGDAGTTPESDAEHFRAWATEELVVKYGLPRPSVGAWFDEHGVLLLLDGLDEGDPADRSRIVQTLSSVRKQLGLGLVVTCRDAEYRAQGARLLCGAAFQIEPLDDAAVADLLRDRGATALLAQIEGNESLLEALRNPLLLALSAEMGSASSGWQGLYERYVERALGAVPQLPRDAFLGRLGWLARAMVRTNTSDLWLERLSGDMLERPWERRAAYASGVSLAGLLGVALNVALVPLTGVGVGVVLVCGLAPVLSSFAYTRGRPLPVERLRWSLRRAREIFPHTVLWIWLANYAAVATSRGLLGALQVNLLVRTLIALILGGVLSLIFGLEPSERATQVRPNAGIRQSLATSLLVSTAGAIPFGLFFHFIFHPLVVVPLESAHVFAGPRVALMATTVVFSLLFLVYGGFAVLMHFALRLWLWQRTPLPFDVQGLLDRAVELGLMRRIGGGYMFLHHTLLQYFAGELPVAGRETTSRERAGEHLEPASAAGE